MTYDSFSTSESLYCMPVPFHLLSTYSSNTLISELNATESRLMIWPTLVPSNCALLLTQNKPLTLSKDSSYLCNLSSTL